MDYKISIPPQRFMSNDLAESVAWTMPRTDEEFHDLMQKVLTGSQEAAQELFRDYEPYLLFAIRRKLDKRMRSKFDSADFAQDVWASFFETPDKRTFNS